MAHDIYTATAKGNRGDIKVSLEYSNGKIHSVTIDEQHESPGITDYALSEIPKMIVENQSYNIDTVTGATITANAIKKAVKNALQDNDSNRESFAKKVDLIRHDENDQQDYKYINESDVKWDQVVDVVIIGAGAAGLCAAIESRKKGLSVDLVEYSPSYLHSNSTLCGGYYYAGGGTRLQKEQGIEDSNEEWRRYLDACGEGFEDSEMTDIFIEKSSDDFDWLIDEIGVNFPVDNTIMMGNERTLAHITKPVARSYYTKEQSGYGITMPLYRKAKELGTNFYFQTTGKKLILDKNKRVIGLHTDKGNFKANKGVIVASAGFSRNKEWIKSFKPEMVSGDSYGSVRQNGDGIRMGIDLGANIANMWMAIADSVGTQTGENIWVGVWLYMWDQPFLYVGTDAKRHFNEDMYYEHAAKELANLDGGYAWMIWDQTAVDNGVENITAPAPSPGLEREVEDGFFKKANSLRNLAEQIGVDPDTFEETISEWNAMMKKDGIDTKYGRTVGNYPIENGPYYAAKVAPSTPDTAGGLCINKKAQVLDVWGNVIDGLYAAGSTTAGWRGKTYPGCGMAITNAVVFGRIAGQDIANN
ncbi:FAD-dependent oxidoreductase [Aerococcus loyolae]|uniref:FAD-dependent oxidoreductase n=1 Tax=Aerococcus loyolae TaxID=2976809 RepID=UPI0007D9E5BC|nr:FAD-dependent oxidoreductase [Aerococcus loyolae]MCY3027778.1 FAD-dependent oxidoreductase [Aerococcus loyolae]OAM71613.1 hypothetical protein A1D21_05785 [Aerococcus loyolae]